MTYKYDSSHMLRIPEHLANMEFGALVEWREQSVSHFTNRVRDLDKKNRKQSDACWSVDLGRGMTRGEIAAEQRSELLGLAQLSDEFGIVTAWAILERFLFQVFKDVKRLKLSLSPKKSEKKSLDFKGYRAMLQEIGVDIATSPIQAAAKAPSNSSRTHTLWRLGDRRERERNASIRIQTGTAH